MCKSTRAARFEGAAVAVHRLRLVDALVHVALRLANVSQRRDRRLAVRLLRGGQRTLTATRRRRVRSRLHLR